MADLKLYEERFNRLKALRDEEFEDLLRRLPIDRAYVPPPVAPLATRAHGLLEYLETRSELNALDAALRALEPVRDDTVRVEPRRESRVIPLTELTDEQCTATNQVHALLREYAKVEVSAIGEGRERKTFLPRIDEERRNQNILLDGDRGSGKSALLVTLLDLWNATFDSDYAAHTEPRHGADRKAKRARWKIDGAWPVVPVGLVDLHPLPRHVPVLLSIAETLVRVVEVIEDRASRDEMPPPWHPGDQPQSESRKRWDVLVRAIVEGWEEASESHWNKLDTESRFYEIDRATRDRLGVVEKFHRFLDALVGDFRKWPRWSRPHAPLFVLAIDDADMIVERSAEVLNAVRLFHHPRLVFLLAGHSGLFYRSVEDDFARDLRSLRGRSRESDRSPVRDEFVQGLAHDYYDKVIPPAQRCALPAIPAEKRHEYVKNLTSLSAKCLRHGPEGERTVLIVEMLKDPSLAGALPERIRALRDVDLLAQRRSGETDSQTLTRVVLYLWRRAIDRNPTEDYTRQHLKTRVYEHSNGNALGVDPLVPRPTARDEGDWVRASSPAKHGDHTVTVRVRGPLWFRGEVREGREVPEAILASLMLADQIAFAHGVARGPESVSSSSGFRPVFGVARYEREPGKAPLQFAWPLPRGRTLLDLSIVNFRWNRVVEALGELTTERVDAAARWFLALVAQLVTGFRDEFNLLPTTFPDHKLPELSWADVARRVLWVAQSGGGLSDRDLNLREWALSRALLLAAPESGLPAWSARQLIEAFRRGVQASVVGAVLSDAGPPPRDFWQTICERAQAERGLRARAVLGLSETQAKAPEADALLEEINRQDREHPWSKLESSSTGPLEVSAGELVQLMNRFGMIVPEEAPRIAFLLTRLFSDNPTLREELLGELKPLGRVGGAGVLAFARMWRKIAERTSFGNLRDVVTQKQGELVVEPVQAHLLHDRDPPLLCGSLVDGTSIEFRRAPDYVLARDSTVLPEVLQNLYELAWDRRAVNTKGTVATPFQDLWSDVISTQVGHEGFRILWPFPPWTHFDQYRRFEEVWNTKLDASTLVGMEAPRTAARVLIADYLAAGNHFPSRRDQFNQWVEPSFRLVPDEEVDLHGLLRKVVGVGERWSGEPMPPLTLRWQLARVLLLAPECGLPQTLAEHFIPPDGDTSSQVKRLFERLQEHGSEIVALRKDRMEASLKATSNIPPEDAQKKLDQLYLNTPDHPWYKFIQKLAPPSRLPAPEPPPAPAEKPRKPKKSK